MSALTHRRILRHHQKKIFVTWFNTVGLFCPQHCHLLRDDDVYNGTIVVFVKMGVKMTIVMMMMMMMNGDHDSVGRGECDGEDHNSCDDGDEKDSCHDMMVVIKKKMIE